MCAECDELIGTLKSEIIALANGELPESISDKDGWTEASRMALVISRAATIISRCEPETNRLNGAPLSIIIGSIAGVAMEAEMISDGLQEVMALFGGLMGDDPASLN